MCLLHPKSYISPAVLSSPFFWVDCRRLFKEGRHRLPGVAAAVVTPAPVPKAGDLFHPPESTAGMRCLTSTTLTRWVVVGSLPQVALQNEEQC